MIITNSRYALVGYFITSYPTRAHGIIVMYSLLLLLSNNEGFMISGRLSVKQKSFSRTIGSFLWSNDMSFSLSDSKAYSFHLSVYRRDFDDENNFSGNYKGK